MRKKLFIKMSVLLVILALTAQISFAKDNISGSKSLNKTLGTPGSTRLNINKISTLLNGNGYSDVSGSNPSYYYPTLSGKTANYESGFIFGAYLGPKSDNLQRICGSTYRTSLTPGRIISPGVADNAANANVRIYRVRRDWKTGSVAVEVQDESKAEADVRSQYEKDWNEWPAGWGAPFEDIGKLGSDGQPIKDAQGNNVKDGVYDPLIDIPGVPGADQTVWFVANDLSATQAATFSQTTPMGIELQCTAWAYKQAGALGSMIFKKYMIINKNANKKDFNEAYCSYWSDTDIGGGSFDYSACDTTLSLFYTYSSNNTNAQYGANPPATGFDFFQGPKVKTGNVKDTAIFNGKFLVGWKNLPMSAHYYFINSDATMQDPDLNSALGISQWYNLFQGKVGVTGAAFVDPTTKKATKFPLAGDPITKTGWLDGTPYAAADRRNGGVAGPFNVAYGDTQEVVIAQISAGASAGIDNIGAVSQLKEYDKTAQIAYNRLFKLPQPAPAPKLTISSFDQKLLLNWGNDAAAVNATEGYSVFGYNFQGYNVYQLPTASSTITDGKLIKTFDVVDHVTYITDKTTDPASGALVDFVAANGGDTGIERTLTVSSDAITGNKLYNGSKYYFAVTSYSYNPAPPFGAKVLENPLAVITAIPNKPAPGYTYSAKSGDALVVTKSGKADGTVTATVVDPSKVTGNAYQVNFADDATLGPVWNLKNTTTNKTVLANQTNLSGDGNYINVDGILVKVVGPPAGVKREDPNTTTDTTKWGWNVKGTRRFTYAGGDPTNIYGLEGYGAASVYSGAGGTVGYLSVRALLGDGTELVKPTELKNVVLRLANVNFTGDFDPPINTSDANVSYGYRWVRNSQLAAADPKFKFTTKATYGYQDYGPNIPLSAWNVDDPKNPKRLAVGFFENNVAAGLVDGKYWPGSNGTIADNAGASGPKEWLFIFDEPYTGATPDAKFQVDIRTTNARMMYWAMWNRRAGYLAWDKTTGTDQFIIYPNHVFANTDLFTFTAPAVGYSADQAKQDVEDINVYPNPYYGINPQELTKYTRWVTFTHLPPKATLRIFNLAGQLVKTIVKDNSDQSQRWDLLNDSAFPVGNGLYIVHIDMPDLGKTKILKVAIIQEKQILDRF